MPPNKFLLVGWDSADWKLIHPLLDAGKMPGVQWLVEGGASGNLTTLEPQLSPMLWTSIATGKMAYDHGICGFTEVDPEGGGVVPVSWASRRCKTVWEILGERGLRSHVVNWFATQGEQSLNGCMVSNAFCHLRGVGPECGPASWPPPPPGTYWPAELAADMNPLRVSPYEVSPDEILRLFIPDAPRIDQQKDSRLWMLTRLLAESFSVHTAATHLMEKDSAWDFCAIYYRALDEICHAFMPYHPPRMDGVSEDDFTMYRGVVEGAYRLHDLFLQRLIHLAGPEATVMLVSDHGFHSDHLRPPSTPNVPAGITVWHRQQGVIAGRGPQFKSDALLFGARLTDITPTILHVFGLPVGEDMEGRVLVEAFENCGKIDRIATWEDPEGIRRPRLGAGGTEHEPLLDLFAALGYIEKSSGDPQADAEDTQRENDWNIARAFMGRGRFLDALPLLERCSDEVPGRTDFAQILAACQLHLGLLEDAEASAERALAAFGPKADARFLRASIAVQKGDHRTAMEILESVRDSRTQDPQLWLLMAQTHVALRQWDDARAAAQKALEIDPHDPRPYLALARQSLHRKHQAAAADYALEGVKLQFDNPHAHYLLAAALSQLERWEDSRTALFNCLKLEPGFLRAYRLLVRSFRMVGDTTSAAVYEQRYFEILTANRNRAEHQAATLREMAGDRARRRREREASMPAESPGKPTDTPIEFVLVSGLPRSGTSLMMQILQAGGMEAMTDGERDPDEHNPEGYWEWEGVKKLPQNPLLIEQAVGKAVKVVCPLLEKLPTRHRYKVIFMLRPIEEIVASQAAMLTSQGRGRGDFDTLARLQHEHRENAIAFLRANHQFDLLEISYPELVSAPSSAIKKLAEFLPGKFSPGEAVRACIKPELHRCRTSASVQRSEGG